MIKRKKSTVFKLYVWMICFVILSQLAVWPSAVSYAEEVVEVKTIASIPSIEMNTTIGNPPILPLEVQAVFSDESVGQVQVRWDEIDPSQYAEAGAFKVEGSVQGTPLKASAEVTVRENDFTVFLNEITSNVPDGQSIVSYSNNYQSMQPELMTFMKGNGTTSVNNGLTVEMNSLEKNIAIAAWDKGPWLSAGTIDATLRYTSGTQGNIGFVIGAYNSTQGLSIRYDAGTTWVIQSPDGSGAWESFEGPELKMDTDYRIKIGYNGNKLLVIVDGVTYYNKETNLLNLKAGIGQVALYKRFATGQVVLKDINIQGVGQTEKPSDIINYVQNYEDPAYTPRWSGLNAQVVTDITGNKVLSLKKGAKERGADLDSPQLQSGTLSLDFKLVNPVKLSSGQGFAFGFRMNETASIFSEIGVDPNRWLPESSSGWGSNLNIPYPIQGKWNNLLFNFNGKTITVYMNKKLVGDITFAEFTDAAGLFGLRIRSTVELYIDNLQYTNQMITPKELVQYSNNFQDGITGGWSSGSSSIIKEGSNRFLKLSGITGTVLNNDAPLLQSATYMLDVKPTTDAIGFAIGNSSLVKFANDHWILEKDGSTIPFVASDAISSSPLVMSWNKVGIQYSDSSVTLSINGAKLTANLPSGQQFGEGSFGVYGQGDLYVDNILFTEEFIQMDTSPVASKMYYEQYYETASSMNWTGLGGSQVVDGYLKGSIASGSVAINEDIVPVKNGVYQVKMKTNASSAGVKIGNAAIYYEGQGKWMYQPNGGEKIAIGDSVEIVPGKDFILRVRLIENELNLYVNGILVGTVQTKNFTPGAFGIYNSGNEVMQVEMDAMTAEEIRIYEPDFTTPNWSAMDSSSPAVLESGEGSVKLRLPGVSLVTDNNSPDVVDQKVTFDFKTSVGAGTDGGRYGFILRGYDDNRYVSIVHDINGTWKLSANGNDSNFPTAYSMAADTVYKIELNLIGNTVTFAITDADDNRTDMGAVTDNTVTSRAGKFGVRSWYSAKEMTIANLKVVEQESMPRLQLAAELDSITKDDLIVTLNKGFPSIFSYQVGNKTMKAADEQTNTLQINNTEYTAQTVSEKVGESKYAYTMAFDEIGVVIKAFIEAKENNVVRFEVSEIQEKSDFVVRSLELNSSLFYVDSSMKGATYAWNKSDGKWHGISEELVDDMSKMNQTGSFGATMTMVSAEGLGASMENNVMSGGNKILVNAEKKSLVNKLTVKPGSWTYRHTQSNEKEALPWYNVVLTEDRNSDGKVDWQDAAVAYRKEIYVQPFGAEDMKNNMMYIAFNFASQANDPFLNALDTGKVLYNYSDGFGQMILEKGYQAEGHDDDIPSYSNIGVRQGGLADFNYFIDEGAKYNLRVGVHLNATEYHLDANELNYSNLTGATPNGYKQDRLSKGWDWIDTSYYVDQTKDVLSGDLKSRFTNLYNLTKDPANPNDPALDFYYIDVYTGNDYNAYKLLQYANGLGLKVGTEFAGPIEPGSVFVHWGTDLGYPNQGNKSILYRLVKNDLDIFVGNALFKGQKIPVVATWGDSKPDIQQGVTVFFNEVLPTKFMQHYGVMKYETDQVTFEQNVVSKRNKASNKIELSKDGKVISSWKDTGTTTDTAERHTSEADSLIPWLWDVKTNQPLGINEGAKLYHWNTTGNTTTWQLTNDFKDVASFNMYELTQQGKVLVDTIAAVDGSLTIAKASKNTPYVLYPATADALNLIPSAGEWGEGSLIKDFAFNSEKFNVEGSWSVNDTANASIKVVQGDVGYDTTKEMVRSNWNRYAEIGSRAGELSQQITGLIPGGEYTVGVWTQTVKGRKSSLQVTMNGKTYSNYVTGLDGSHQSSFKYVDTTWQRMNVKFKVPEGTTTATIKLIADAGAGTVLFDDVRIWKHLTSGSGAEHAGYVVKEDFENVYEGWGPFEYGGGSRMIHIASDQSNPHDNNPVVQAADQKIGPVMTWVLNGQNSLKLNETDVGRLIKSNESDIKLKAIKTYELGFAYTMENGVTYEVSVLSRATGAVVLKETLQNKPNSGIKAEDGYIRYSQTFTTGAQDDYQVVFKMIAKGAGNATSDYAFILDDFYIKTTGVDYAKELLLQAIKDAQALKEAEYTPVTWATVAATLQSAIEVSSNAEATIEMIESARTALEKAVSELETHVIAIVSLQAVSVTTTVGKAPVLPHTVRAVYSDKSVKDLLVVWNAIKASDYAQTGTFEVEGTVAGTTLKAIATVHVQADNSGPGTDPGTGTNPGTGTGPGTGTDPGAGIKVTFQDTASHWARKEIEALAAKGILTGVSENKFNPNASITRAEIAAMFTRGFNLQASTSQSFEDVRGDKWYNNVISAASESGLLQGTGGNRFEPDRSLTREEMAVIITRVLQMKGKLPTLATSEDAILASFKDEDQAAAWSRNALAICIQAGLLKGMPDQTLKANKELTRAEAAIVLSRLFDYLE